MKILENIRNNKLAFLGLFILIVAIGGYLYPKLDVGARTQTWWKRVGNTLIPVNTNVSIGNSSFDMTADQASTTQETIGTAWIDTLKVTSCTGCTGSSNNYGAANAVAYYASAGTIATGTTDMTWDDTADVLTVTYASTTALTVSGTLYATISGYLAEADIDTLAELNAILAGEDAASTTWSGASSITTVGTVGTGTWQGDAIDHERGGLEADVSAWSGLVSITGGASAQVTTLAALNALLPGETIASTTGAYVATTDIDTIAELNAILAGEDVASTTWSGASSITTVGTIGTGTWQGDVIDHERGGLEADVSAWSGLISITGGSSAQVTTLAALNALLPGETVASTSATFSGATFDDDSNTLTNIDGENIKDDTIDVDSLDWGAFTDLGEGGAVTWGNLGAGELADDSIINADIDDDGNFTFTGNWDFSGGDVDLPNDSVDDADINWAGLTDMVAGGEVSWGNVGAGELANDSIIDADIDDDGNFAFTGKWDFGGGDLEVPNGATVSDPNAAGEVAIDTTSDQFLYYGGAQRVLHYSFDKSLRLASSTRDKDFNQFSSGTTTHEVWNPRYAVTLTDLYCKTDDAGTVQVRCGDGTNWTEYIECTTSGVEDDGSIANGTFTSREDFVCETGSSASDPDAVTITATFNYNAD